MNFLYLLSTIRLKFSSLAQASTLKMNTSFGKRVLIVVFTRIAVQPVFFSQSLKLSMKMLK